MPMQTPSTTPVEFVTLIGTDMAEITAAFRDQGLAAQHYSIVHRTGDHRFTRVDGTGSEAMFDGRTMIAATFRRCASA